MTGKHGRGNPELPEGTKKLNGRRVSGFMLKLHFIASPSFLLRLANTDQKKSKTS